MSMTAEEAFYWVNGVTAVGSSVIAVTAFAFGRVVLGLETLGFGFWFWIQHGRFLEKVQMMEAETAEVEE